jgi:outer membrane protein
MNKRFGFAVLCAAAFAAAAPAQAQTAVEGPWLVRLRALNLDPANKDSTGLKLAIDRRTFAEVDISYFFSPNLAAELVLTYPQKHTITSGGAKSGTV